MYSKWLIYSDANFETTFGAKIRDGILFFWMFHRFCKEKSADFPLQWVQTNRPLLAIDWFCKDCIYTYLS